MKFILSY